MNCPKCDAKTITHDTRDRKGRRWRRRSCENGHRFTTWEVAETELDAMLESDAADRIAAAIAEATPELVKLITRCLRKREPS